VGLRFIEMHLGESAAGTIRMGAGAALVNGAARPAGSLSRSAAEMGRTGSERTAARVLALREQLR
jgi:hypothetical protein